MTSRWASASLILLAGCSAAPVAPPAAAAPAAIRRLALQPFEGKNGPAVRQALTAALSADGIQIVAINQNPDAVMFGAIREFKGHTRMVYLGETPLLAGNKAVTVTDPVVPLAGQRAVPPSPEAAKKNPHIVIDGAVAQLTLWVRDPVSDAVLWAGEFSYEGLDPALARDAVVMTLARSFRRAVPDLKRFRS